MASNLFFPYDIAIRGISQYAIPTHSVDIATSAAGLETRTLISDERSKGYIDITIDNENERSNESLEEFHQAVKTTHLSFEIKDDHNLWELIPAHSKLKFLPLWRFDSQLVFTAEDVRACLYVTSLRLLNVKA